MIEIPKCDCYHDGVCWGTREKDECNCGGNILRCNFYPEKIEAAKDKYNLCCESCKRYADEYDAWCYEHCKSGVPYSDEAYNKLPLMWEENSEKVAPITSEDYKTPEIVTTAPSMVEHPQHYNQGGIECIDAANAMVSGYTDAIDASLSWQVIKYLWRHPFKAKPIEDLKKCQWYLERLIKYLENKN